MNGRPIDILLVEDNPADARLAQEALRDTGGPHALHHVQRGDEALTYLRRAGGHEAASRPDLILLDLNLPGMGGHDVLAALKSDPELRRIPVIVLSSSQADQDVLRRGWGVLGGQQAAPGGSRRIPAALPSRLPACGPRSRLSPEKHTTSTPAAILSCGVGSCDRP